MKHKNLYFLKLGGSVITHQNIENSADMLEISRLLKEVKSGIGDFDLVLGHGSGSFGHIASNRYNLAAGFTNIQSRIGTSIAQDVHAKLHRIVIERMLDFKMLPSSFAPSNCALTKKGKIISWNLGPIKQSLDLGFIPVTYGDIILDREKGVSDLSTEEVFRFLGQKLRPSKIIVGTNIDGLYTGDPNLNKDAELVREVNRGNIKKVLKFAGGSRKIDTTGGMRSKLLSLYETSRVSGAECYIVNAKKKNRVYDILRGKKGDWTRICY
ncbi:MAG: hypothetical protein KGH65_03020 [Candidatus Micrarchaeota archaeon]|nr:hypothetical protein [Candidatus Micrarchaeota archaeon]